MTTTRTHTCNLCRRTVTETEGVGLKWTGHGTGELIQFTTPGQAESHLCNGCVENLDTAISDLRRIERERDERATYMPAGG
jgi:hypothetical protein